MIYNYRKNIEHFEMNIPCIIAKLARMKIPLKIRAIKKIKTKSSYKMDIKMRPTLLFKSINIHEKSIFW